MGDVGDRDDMRLSRLSRLLLASAAGIAVAGGTVAITAATTGVDIISMARSKIVPPPAGAATTSPSPTPSHPATPSPDRFTITPALIARSLGITPAQLRAAQQGGMTVHQIADSRGITEAQFRTRLAQNLSPMLERAVADGSLTRDKESQILVRVRAGPLPVWDQKP